MRWTIPALALVVTSTLALSSETPSRGDVVHVAAELVSFHAGGVSVGEQLFGIDTGPRESAIPACIGMTVRRVWKKRQEFSAVAEADKHIYVVLTGDWSGRIYEDRETCLGAFESEGQPVIIRNMARHTIVSDDP